MTIRRSFRLTFLWLALSASFLVGFSLDPPLATGKYQISKRQSLKSIPNSKPLAKASDDYEAVFEVRDDRLVGKHLRSSPAGRLGLKCWERMLCLFPLSYRKLIVQFNVMKGRGAAGRFSGDGSNDVGRAGFRISIARYLLEKSKKNLGQRRRRVSRKRRTLDWTLVHEMGHYICLRTNAIELFSQRFDSDRVQQPRRRKNPKDYPKDGSPRLQGDFVTSYAERTPGDEEVVETFTTYLLVSVLPNGDSLVVRKIRFFETMPGFPELRKHIQAIGRSRKGASK